MIALESILALGGDIGRSLEYVAAPGTRRMVQIAKGANPGRSSSLFDGKIKAFVLGQGGQQLPQQVGVGFFQDEFGIVGEFGQILGANGDEARHDGSRIVVV